MAAIVFVATAPLPRSVREAIERYEEKHDATKDGYPLCGPGR